MTGTSKLWPKPVFSSAEKPLSGHILYAGRRKKEFWDRTRNKKKKKKRKNRLVCLLSTLSSLSSTYLFSFVLYPIEILCGLEGGKVVLIWGKNCWNWRQLKKSSTWIKHGSHTQSMCRTRSTNQSLVTYLTLSSLPLLFFVVSVTIAELIRSTETGSVYLREWIKNRSNNSELIWWWI